LPHRRPTQAQDLLDELLFPDTCGGADHARHSRLQAAMANEVLFALPLRGDEQVLDAGCGDGKPTARIAQKLPRGAVPGVYASACVVSHAQRQFCGAAWPNLRFEAADVRRLEFGPRFDRVVSCNTLPWLPQHDQALRGIRRALKPRGQAHRLVTPAS
jgi:trans-aconitate 2-methyltransferase